MISLFALFIGCSDKESITDSSVIEPATPQEDTMVVEPEAPSLSNNGLGGSRVISGRRGLVSQ